MYTRTEQRRMIMLANKPLREAYVGDLSISDMRVVREANGDVVIEGIDPNNLGRLDQIAIRMSADEWQEFVARFASLASFI